VSDLLTVPDRQVGWIPSALSAALRLVEEEEISAIYSSSPPASGHVAALLAARLTGRPWIADFRDPWTSDHFAPDRSLSLVRPLDRFLEAAVLADAARVVANTDRMRADFARRFPECARKLVTITNGYDPEEALPSIDPPAADRPFTITHAGTLYGPRDPSPLLRAVRALLERGAVSPERLRILFIGSVSGEMPWRDLLESPLLSRVVRFEPKVSRGEVLHRLAASDLLLVVQAGTDLQVPRKLYEYMALGKPILALVTGGATETLVREEGAGRIVRPDDPEGIEKALLEALRGEGLPRPERPERFDVRRLTGALAEVLEEAVR
jgi:glycosyltransferase involved in cell wall biosynthesis